MERLSAFIKEGVAAFCKVRLRKNLNNVIYKPFSGAEKIILTPSPGLAPDNFIHLVATNARSKKSWYR